MMADNPFLPGGDISKDAEEIVNAFKAGKLSCLSDNGKNVQEADSEDDEKMMRMCWEDDEKMYAGSGARLSPRTGTHLEAIRIC